MDTNKMINLLIASICFITFALFLACMWSIVELNKEFSPKHNVPPYSILTPVNGLDSYELEKK